MVEQIQPPWSVEQVATLNTFQVGGFMHPFMCGRKADHPNDQGLLLATRAGWVCPVHECEYTQDWAHDFMADQAWVQSQIDKMSRLFGRR
jgi:hypothetical protein